MFQEHSDFTLPPLPDTIVQNYRLVKGKWSSVDDPLQGQPLTESVYKNSSASEPLSCFGLKFHIYVYEPPKKNAPSPTYLFCCIFSFSSYFEVRIWATDFIELLQLLLLLRPTESGLHDIPDEIRKILPNDTLKVYVENLEEK